MSYTFLNSGSEDVCFGVRITFINILIIFPEITLFPIENNVKIASTERLYIKKKSAAVSVGFQPGRIEGTE